MTASVALLPPYSTLKTSSERESGAGLAAAEEEEDGSADGSRSPESEQAVSSVAPSPTARPTRTTEARRMATSISLTVQSVSSTLGEAAARVHPLRVTSRHGGRQHAEG